MGTKGRVKDGQRNGYGLLFENDQIVSSGDWNMDELVVSIEPNLLIPAMIQTKFLLAMNSFLKSKTPSNKLDSQDADNTIKFEGTCITDEKKNQRR